MKKEDCYHIHICNITFGFYVLSTYIYRSNNNLWIIIINKIYIKFPYISLCYEYLFDISNLVTLKLVSNK